MINSFSICNIFMTVQTRIQHFSFDISPVTFQDHWLHGVAEGKSSLNEEFSILEHLKGTHLYMIYFHFSFGLEAVIFL